MSVLRTQLAGVARRPSRLLLTGLAVLVASFVVYATVLTREITEQTLLDQASGTPAAAGLVVGALPGGEGTSPEVTMDEYKLIKALPGVAEAVARLSAGGTVGQDYLSIDADPGSGPLALAHLRSGTYPARPGEIAVTPRTAERMGLPVGSTVTIRTDYDDDGNPIKPRTLRITGIVDTEHDFGASAYAPQSTVAALTSYGPSQIDLRLDPGFAADDVRAAAQRVIAAAPAPAEGMPKPEVLTGAEIREAEARLAVSEIDDIFVAVGLFVAIAVAAAGLVATSTFRIVFAQRMRQLALLRAIGAGRGAIRRALAVEGALTGLVTGVCGVLAALAVGHLVPPVLRGFGIELASPGFPVLPALGVVALAVVITVLAVIAPAFTAARVAPLEALRSASTSAARRDIGRARAGLGILLTLGGAAPAAYVIMNLPGRDPENYDPQPMLLATVASGTLIFLALMALGPVLIRPVLAAVGAPLRRLGPVGKLAVGGVGGTPRRAAAVSVVVALGVTLIAGVVVTGASFREYAERELATSAPADFELVGSVDEPIGAELVEQAAASPDLAHVTPYRRLTQLRVGDQEAQLTAVDLDLTALPALTKLRPATGSLAGIAPGKVAISGFTSDITGLTTGDTTTVAAGGKSVRVQVVATLPDSGPLQAYVLMTPDDLTKLGAPAGYSGVLADAAADGESGRTAGLQALRQVTAGRTGIGTTVLADQRDEVGAMVNGILAVVIGLIGLTVAIAVVGVGTTTALSVVERTRESGLLRAVGLSRTGLRTMLTAEAGLYGLVGAVLGLLLGVPYAWLALKAFGVGAPLVLPVWQLATVLVALAALTALAGVLPARRAAKVSPVAALAVD